MTVFDLLETAPALLIGSAFLLSLLIGSFLNVVIHRLPVMLDRQWRAQAQEMLTDGSTAPAPAAPEPAAYNLVTPRSACPHCNAPIRAHQNIPVVSYLLLGGKCANCRTKISPRYPIVELATAILSAAVVWRFGWHWQSVAALFFTWALVALTVIDLDHQILPGHHYAAPALAGPAAEPRVARRPAAADPRRPRLGHHRRRGGLPDALERLLGLQAADR